MDFILWQSSQYLKSQIVPPMFAELQCNTFQHIYLDTICNQPRLTGVSHKLQLCPQHFLLISLGSADEPISQLRSALKQFLSDSVREESELGLLPEAE